MVKTFETIEEPNVDKTTESQQKTTAEEKEFEYENELNNRITNRKRRNALTLEMADDIKKMLQNGDFST